MESPDVTSLLARIREGERSALDELVPIVYDELRRMARALMRGQRSDHTLQPTALINEAFMKLIGQEKPQFVDSVHFLAVMARVMRQVLVDHARSAGAAKRGGRDARAVWTTNIQVSAEQGDTQVEVLALHTALDRLAIENPVLAEVLEMNCFGGMTTEEIAGASGRSVHVVRREVRVARAWLRRELASQP